MRTNYEFALNYFNLSLLRDQYIKNKESDGRSAISIGSSFAIFDLFNFEDRMDVSPSGFKSKTGITSTVEQFMNAIGYIPSFGDNDPYYISPDTIQGAMSSTIKAMLVAILDGDSKRSTTVGIGSSTEKAQIFFNTLMDPQWRDYTIKPWNTWRNSVGIITPVSIARSDNVAIVTTNPPHGLSTSFDDWGVVMNLNTGIGTESFNTLTSIYPNGVPISITSPTTFTYKNIGINTQTTSVTGTADVRIGWGGTSNNLHLYFA